MKRNGYSTIVSVNRDDGTITLATPSDVVNFEVGIPVEIDLGRSRWVRLRVFFRELPAALRDLWRETKWL